MLSNVLQHNMLLNLGLIRSLQTHKTRQVLWGRTPAFTKGQIGNGRHPIRRPPLSASNCHSVLADIAAVSCKPRTNLMIPEQYRPASQDSLDIICSSTTTFNMFEVMPLSMCVWCLDNDGAIAHSLTPLQPLSASLNFTPIYSNMGVKGLWQVSISDWLFLPVTDPDYFFVETCFSVEHSFLERACNYRGLRARG